MYLVYHVLVGDYRDYNFGVFEDLQDLERNEIGCFSS